MTQSGYDIENGFVRTGFRVGDCLPVDHAVDDCSVGTDDVGPVVLEVVMQPDAEVRFHPLEVEAVFGVADGVVPDRDAFLIVGNLFHAADQSG